MGDRLASSRIAALSFAAMLGVFACDGDAAHDLNGQEIADAGSTARADSPDPAHAAGDAASSGAAPIVDDAAPTWSGIYANVFRTCRIDTCHGGGLIGLDFASKDSAWRSLVDQPAAADSLCATFGKPRVRAGDPDASLLYLKLDSNAPCGSQMPPGGQLSQAARDRVHAWIEMGADND